jgi:uncharacterized protein
MNRTEKNRESKSVHDTAVDKLVHRLCEDQHTLPFSIALHLIPGLLTVAAYWLVGAPVVEACVQLHYSW